MKSVRSGNIGQNIFYPVLCISLQRSELEEDPGNCVDRDADEEDQFSHDSHLHQAKKWRQFLAQTRNTAADANEQGRSVRFDFAATTVYEIPPQEETYGSDLCTFVFNSDADKIPAAACGFVSAPCDPLHYMSCEVCRLSARPASVLQHYRQAQYSRKLSVLRHCMHACANYMSEDDNYESGDDDEHWEPFPVVVVNGELVNVTVKPGSQLGLQYEFETGLITDVLLKSPAGHAGVQRGWSILKINGKPYSQNELNARRRGHCNFTVTFRTGNSWLSGQFASVTHAFTQCFTRGQ